VRYWAIPTFQEESFVMEQKNTEVVRGRKVPTPSLSGSGLICAATRPSIVIVTYNSAEDIDACLSACASSDVGLSAEIIVVDNASNDNTCSIVARHPGVRLIRKDANKGFAAAVNHGIASSSSDYVLVLNPDVVVSRDAVLALMETLELREEYAAAGCRMVYPNGRAQLSARPFPTVTTFLKRALLTNNLVTKLFRPHEFDEQWSIVSDDSSPVRVVDYIIGGCMMIRRSAFAAIGPLDEKYFLYYEDTDWCYRAQLKGWKIGYLPRPSIVHDYKRSSSKVSFTNPLTWVHLTSACRFFWKVAGARGLKAII
jgi:N-acetylglucosaminyl-diphospho-decaprenol L-rhamnosyltransferase